MRAQQRTALVINPGAELYGSDRMTLETVRALIERQWRVVASVPRYGPLVSALQAVGAEVHEVDVPVLRKSALTIKGSLRLAAGTAKALIPLWRTLRRVHPDVVYVSTITTPLWLLVPALVRIPVVCHVHEAEASARMGLLRALNAPLLACRAVVVNSHFSLGVLLKAHPRLGRRARVIDNAVQGPSHPTPSRPVLQDGCRLLYVGRLSTRKGPDVAVRAAHLLAQRGVIIHLDLVGAVFAGNEQFEVDLRHYVEAHSLADIRFRGFESDVWPRLAACDIVLVPSTVDEPFGNTAVEASLAGRPVVVSDIAGLREATAGRRAVVRVTPGDDVALADAVQVIIEDWMRFRALAAFDADEAARRFSPDTYGAKVSEVIGACASMAPR